MQTLQSSLITIICDEFKFEADFELPTFLKIEKLELKMIESLKTLNPSLFFCVSGLTFVFNGRILDKNESLSSAGIWDGAIVTMKTEKN